MDNNLKYKSVDYWNERYKEEDHFEWFGDYEKYKPVLGNKIKPSDQILVLGCGNSRLSEHMYTDGYANIVNTDYSDVVIERMRQRYATMDKMKWLVMDINELEFDDGTFECVLEKGTFDALLVDEKDPWRLSEENSVKLDKILENVSRVLKPNGVFISITFAQPHFRKPVYAKEKYNWSIEEFRIGDMFHYFVYVMTKGRRLNEKDTYLGLKSSCVSTVNNEVNLNENDISSLDL